MITFPVILANKSLALDDGFQASCKLASMYTPDRALGLKESKTFIFTRQGHVSALMSSPQRPMLLLIALLAKLSQLCHCCL